MRKAYAHSFEKARGAGRHRPKRVALHPPRDARRIDSAPARRKPAPGGTEMLPRTIWCLWFQGWAHAPDLVKACAASWQRHNPDWDLRLLSGDTLDAYLDPLSH